MLILTLRTDKPEAEIGLYNDNQQVVYHTWTAHRQLAETLHTTIKELLDSQEKKWDDLEGIGVYKGPGSFTGLRIGLSVGNALAASLQIPIVGATQHDWRTKAINELLTGADHKQVLPEYGADVHTTIQKK